MTTIALRRSAVRPLASVTRPSPSAREQDVEDVAVGLLDLVEQQHAEGLLAQPPGELALAVRLPGRADQPRQGVARRRTRPCRSAPGGRALRTGSSASTLAISVLPTPVGPTKKRLASGLRRVVEPGLDDRDQVDHGVHRLGLAQQPLLEVGAQVGQAERGGVGQEHLGRPLRRANAAVACSRPKARAPVGGGAAAPLLQQPHRLAREGPVGHEPPGQLERGVHRALLDAHPGPRLDAPGGRGDDGRPLLGRGSGTSMRRRACMKLGSRSTQAS